MNSRQLIYRFSPNQTDPELLEQINVQRQELLEQSVAVLRESALTDNKHHLLFVGPRGCGKTHMLALIFHRLQKQADLADCLRIAWLNEDETSTSFLDLLARIYRALSDRYPDEFPQADIQALYGRVPAEARDLLSQSILARMGKRTVLVLVENLDALFAQFDEEEQRAWRAFLQDHPRFATAATAQSLFASVAERESPFFGFFDTHHLQPLSPEEATELFQRIARRQKNTPLAKFLETPRGRARVQAIHYLSGGNHRLHIVLSDFITQESLDELVGPFEEMVDEQLTPYYQERLRWLAPMQRKIVEFLSFRTRPMAVSEIAAGLFAEPGTVSKQLQKLREMGYVRSTPRGRESLYELAEPLMRLSMEIKSTHNKKPLRMIVNMLRVWYEREELERLAALAGPAGRGREYLAAALQPLSPGEVNPREESLRLELADLKVEHCDLNQLERLQFLATESCDPVIWMKYGHACYFHERFQEAAMWLGKVADMPISPSSVAVPALICRGVALGRMGRVQDEVADYTRAVQFPGAPADLVAKALFNRALAFARTGRTQDEIDDYTRILELPGAPQDPVVRAYLKRGLCLGRIGRIQDAIIDFTHVIEIPDTPTDLIVMALLGRGAAFAQTGQNLEEIADYTRVIELPTAPTHQIALAVFNRGVALGRIGRTLEAMADYTGVIHSQTAQPDTVAMALVNRGTAAEQLGLVQEATADYASVIELSGAPMGQVIMALINRGCVLGRMGQTQEAAADFTRAIDLPSTDVQLLTKALVNRAITFDQTGRTQDAMADCKRAVSLEGAPSDVVIRAKGLLASILIRLGRWSEGLSFIPGSLDGRATPDPVAPVVADAVIEALFQQVGEREVCRARAAQVTLLYAEYKALPGLSISLVFHLSKLAKSNLNSAGLDEWLSHWQMASAKHEEMELPLRLLAAGIAYLKTTPRDEGALLALPKEERGLVRQALGLEKEPSE
jgi:tetratricopeptide (TPR) repeat protein